MKCKMSKKIFGIAAAGAVLAGAIIAVKKAFDRLEEFGEGFGCGDGCDDACCGCGDCSVCENKDVCECSEASENKETEENPEEAEEETAE